MKPKKPERQKMESRGEIPRSPPEVVFRKQKYSPTKKSGYNKYEPSKKWYCFYLQNI
jgi:hypothetical protein